MDKDIKQVVREGYGAIALQGSSCCDSGSSCCCDDTGSNISLSLGYSEEDLSSTPEGANLGLGCGNPLALASLKEGEVVLDLGSGGGFDCFLAANAVGETGHVIGVDMTPEMLELAKTNAEKGGYKNVEFRAGEIENLPVDDNSVDVIISNCVINLSPEKDKVFAEAFRVLKPGGRLMVSDIVLLAELPSEVRESVDAYVSCISGAIDKKDYILGVSKAGFKSVDIMEENPLSIEYQGGCNCGCEAPESAVLSEAIASMKISAVKP